MAKHAVQIAHVVLIFVSITTAILAQRNKVLIVTTKLAQVILNALVELVALTCVYHVLLNLVLL
jgi:hypothetical protein